MTWTPYHAKYFAYELTQRFASKVTAEGFNDADNLDKITASLSDAQVDLNPHQVDAALFALRSPLSQGVILADEVGLGKTIEAGIVIAQRWAERKRRILIIAPANLRKQWSQELSDKFFLSSLILEKKSFDESTKQKNFNPFEQKDKIVICSFQFARAKEAYVSHTNWDLVVIDEAHRLRNVYRKDNKIGNALKEALAQRPKILLTATPLQNSLLELYGLISLVDEYIFGDLRSFRQQYARISSEEQFSALKRRIEPVCKRTLRAQVREYVRYTERICITSQFSSADDEHELYTQVSEYLRKPTLYALPAGQRTLMTLILRKLLASSSFAIADTLKGLAEKLQAILDRHEILQTAEEPWQVDFETSAELQDEWNDDPDFADEVQEAAERYFSAFELEEIRKELTEVQFFHELAQNIQRNSKGDNLVIALQQGFAKMRELGAAEKAVIFTESIRTQQYVKEILEQSGFKDKIVLFNGSNSDSESTRIYHHWLKKHEHSDRITGSRAADIRAALTEYFKEDAQILIATEAAAEGINLQFCSMVVNYDMPWNPQRIEQRIGRCHRYGQRFNVVVINFLNARNAADVRVHELLNEKFALFNGVFGASDEVLGSIESGVDFEKRIVQIYQNCRTEAEIQAAFDALRAELDESIAQRLDYTHQQLMENFDEEVLEKIKVESEQRLDAFEEKFWAFSRFALAEYANQFDDENHSFRLLRSPLSDVPKGNFRFLSHRLPHDRLPKDAQVYRIGHPLARHLLKTHQGQGLPVAEVVFDFKNAARKVSALEPLVGASGWLRVDRLCIEGLENEDFLVFAGMDDTGELIEQERCRRMFSLPGQVVSSGWEQDQHITQALQAEIQLQRNLLMERRNQRDIQLFDLEMDKLDRWASDQRLALHTELREIEQDIRLRRNLVRQAPTLAERVKEQRHIAELEKKLADKRFALHSEEDTIEVRKNRFLDEIQEKLDVKPEQEMLFAIRWHLKV
ncbi:SNF2-related protein [Haliscomenobacter sp.]|uniref:SNF2-related protein n=1 Tax=Haliscomenobacter sp. TaxID=2717303 RepID=UPI003593371D